MTHNILDNSMQMLVVQYIGNKYTLKNLYFEIYIYWGYNPNYVCDLPIDPKSSGETNDFQIGLNSLFLSVSDYV